MSARVCVIQFHNNFVVVLYILTHTIHLYYYLHTRRFENFTIFIKNLNTT